MHLPLLSPMYSKLFDSIVFIIFLMFLSGVVNPFLTAPITLILLFSVYSANSPERITAAIASLIPAIKQGMLLFNINVCLCLTGKVNKCVFLGNGTQRSN